MFIHNREKAFSVLPVVLLIGGLIVEIGISGLFISYFLGSSGFGVKISEEALSSAKSGIDDAIIKIIRNKGSVISSPYNVNIGNNSAQISIMKDLPSAGKYEIVSLGSAGLKRRKLTAVINVNNYDGEVKVEFMREIAI
ncbi:MAG: hypothetical protein UR88_C0004G0002 [Candidatus Nomurabacteria bacterium GW2011_GWA1_35_8]|uniref:Uncharacterized protein n=1 Tax=Candidatus Nomurabacteria bacterium GW2011_GWA1_35_8 TaxID=1618727 RepID=A0A0G0FES9_9BACT|nr:MAG: hypothetical protein UR88_C0004G0002 [Candidatus Nomurabacteria bacterium GW2011_GWA1_35_8]